MKLFDPLPTKSRLKINFVVVTVFVLETVVKTIGMSSILVFCIDLSYALLYYISIIIPMRNTECELLNDSSLNHTKFAIFFIIEKKTNQILPQADRVFYLECHVPI